MACPPVHSSDLASILALPSQNDHKNMKINHFKSSQNIKKGMTVQQKGFQNSLESGKHGCVSNNGRGGTLRAV